MNKKKKKRENSIINGGHIESANKTNVTKKERYVGFITLPLSLIFIIVICIFRN